MLIRLFARLHDNSTFYLLFHIIKIYIIYRELTTLFHGVHCKVQCWGHCYFRYTYSPLARSLQHMDFVSITTADDLQLYCHFDLTATALSATLRRRDDCLEVVNMWMASNYMCINNNKTEYLPVIPKTAAATVLRLLTVVLYV